MPAKLFIDVDIFQNDRSNLIQRSSQCWDDGQALQRVSVQPPKIPTPANGRRRKDEQEPDMQTRIKRCGRNKAGIVASDTNSCTWGALWKKQS